MLKSRSHAVRGGKKVETSRAKCETLLRTSVSSCGLDDMAVRRLDVMVKALVDTPAAASDEKNDFDAMSITVSGLISSMNIFIDDDDKGDRTLRMGVR
jgi:hypothetical protein